MSCLPGPSYTADDVERWTMNVNLLLDSPRGRRRFEEFLSEWKLTDEEVTLKFWERCNQVLSENADNKHLKKNSKSSKIHRDRLIKQAIELVEYAEEYINFDVAQLREFRQSVETNDAEKILKAISRAQRSTTDLLKSKFELFRKNIQKELPPLKPLKK